MKPLTFLFSTILITSFAVNEGISFAPTEITDQNKSIIVLFREPGFVGAGLSPLIKLNDIEVGPLHKGGIYQ